MHELYFRRLVIIPVASNLLASITRADTIYFPVEEPQ